MPRQGRTALSRWEKRLHWAPCSVLPLLREVTGWMQAELGVEVEIEVEDRPK